MPSSWYFKNPRTNLKIYNVYLVFRSRHHRYAIKKVFSCEFFEISKNSFFTEHLWTTASKNKPFILLILFYIIYRELKVVVWCFCTLGSFYCSSYYTFAFSEAVAWGCSVKKVFLEILQNSQENTCARVFF